MKIPFTVLHTDPVRNVAMMARVHKADMYQAGLEELSLVWRSHLESNHAITINDTGLRWFGSERFLYDTVEALDTGRRTHYRFRDVCSGCKNEPPKWMRMRRVRDRYIQQLMRFDDLDRLARRLPHAKRRGTVPTYMNFRDSWVHIAELPEEVLYDYSLLNCDHLRRYFRMCRPYDISLPQFLNRNRYHAMSPERYRGHRYRGHMLPYTQRAVTAERAAQITGV
jgi:hypothetical protein